MVIQPALGAGAVEHTGQFVWRGAAVRGATEMMTMVMMSDLHLAHDGH